MERKCKANQLVGGEIVSRTSYLTIQSNSSGNSIEVINTDGVEWQINGREIIENEIYSSKQFAEEIKLSMTALAQAFVDIPGDAVFTVGFTKKDGSHRVLVGHRLSNDQNILGRSDVYDLEKQGIRQVDHRTIQWFICKNKKYILK